MNIIIQILFVVVVALILNYINKLSNKHIKEMSDNNND